MSRVIVDIETAGFDFEAMPEKNQEYLLKFSQSKEEEEEIKKRLALYPLTAETVAIGMLNPDTNKGTVLFQDANLDGKKFEEEGITFEPGSEEEILKIFWKLMESYDQLITFNGRGFDAPFLILRSALKKIKPTKNLMGYRYDFKSHCDLLEQLTFYGATRRFSLDFYARSFGIKSSKEGMSGEMVGELYKKGEYEKIARYCARDLVATKELYEYWDKYIRF